MRQRGPIAAGALALAGTLGAAALTGTVGAAGNRQVLVDAQRGIHVDRWQTSGRGPGGRTWSVTKRTLRGGKSEGVDVIEIDNGRLRFAVVPTRGLGILSATYNGVSFGWKSPVRETVNPAFVELGRRGGLGWVEGFNEFMCRCGLENVGAPGTDRWTNPDGTESTQDLTLHGKIANIPASFVEVSVDAAAPHRIHVRGRVDERGFHGPKYELRTDISTEPGSNTIRVNDVITNRGGTSQEWQLLYHTNYGPPLLDAGAKLLAPAERVIPHTDHAAKDARTYAIYKGPTTGYAEQVYDIFPLADNGGRTVIGLQNKAGDLAASIAFSTKELPLLTVWKDTGAMSDGYVTGLEPGTSFPNNRRIERAKGRVPKLAAGESHSVTVDFGFHTGADEVRRLAARVAAIQGSSRIQIDTAPEQKD